MAHCHPVAREEEPQVGLIAETGDEMKEERFAKGKHQIERLKRKPTNYESNQNCDEHLDDLEERETNRTPIAKELNFWS